MSLRERIAAAGRGKFNRSPVWAVRECRDLYRSGLTVDEVSRVSGLSQSTIENWRRDAAGGWHWSGVAPWDEITPLEPVKRSRIVMPADAGECLVIAAELLWLARKPV